MWPIKIKIRVTVSRLDRKKNIQVGDVKKEKIKINNVAE